MGRYGCIFLLLTACPAPQNVRRPETYSDNEEHVTQATPKKSTPKSNTVPSPVSSPKGSEVDNQPVGESETPPNDQVGQIDASRKYGGGIGSNCGAGVACVLPADACLKDGYPDGMCSKACSRYCPDAPGQALTFCIADRSGWGGICVPKCESDADCRTGYRCATKARFNEPIVERKVCVPKTFDLDDRDCLSEYKALTGDGSSWAKANDTAQICGASVACYVNQPMLITDLLNDVFIHEEGANQSEPLQVSCPMAHALFRMTASLKKKGVSEVRYSRLYACENTALFSSQQPHALGDAFDVGGMFHGHGQSIDITAMVIDGVDHTVAEKWGTFEEWKSTEQRAALESALKQLKTDHVFNNIYTPYCNQVFGHTGTYSIPPFFHADIGAASMDEMVNPQYGLDDTASVLCTRDFPTYCE